MIDGGRKLCMNCMATMDDVSQVCESCGYDNESRFDLNYLAPGTILQERYIVGRLIMNNGESATYIGYDASLNCKITVREYMPMSIVSRNQVTQEIIPIPGYEAQYKALFADFEDLCIEISKLSSEAIIPIAEIFHDSNTVYAIYRNVTTITFGDFLNRSGGELTWNQAKRLFMPLFNTISNVHKHGLIHRGISPTTIRIDQNGRLWLSEFSIAAVRTDRSELEAEVFPGYSSPEQYSLNSWQGTWTDVYALAAVLYKSLTGVAPPESINRKISDSLEPASKINISVPKNVENAIINAMIVPIEQRTQTVDQLSAGLLETQDCGTAVYSASTRAVLLDEQETKTAMKSHTNGAKSTATTKPTPKRIYKRKKTRTGLYFSLAMVVTLLVLGSMLYYLVTNYYKDLVGLPLPSETTTVQTQDEKKPKLVPNFKDMSIKSILENKEYNAQFDIIVKEEENTEYPAGMVFDQSPKADTPMQNRGAVIIKVSKGTEKVKVPELKDKNVEAAKEILNSLEIRYEIIESYMGDAKPGTVMGITPTPGTEIIKNSYTDVVLLTVRVASPQTTTPQTTTPQTTEPKKSTTRRRITSPPSTDETYG